MSEANVESIRRHYEIRHGKALSGVVAESPGQA
jgi:hypothetical protein